MPQSLVLPVPPFVPLGFVTGRMIGMMIGIVSLAFGSMMVGLMLRGSAFGAAGRAVLVGGAISMAIGVAVLLVDRHNQRRRTRATHAALVGARGSGEPSSLERAIDEELHAAALRDRLALRRSGTDASWRQFRDAVAARTGSPPSTIVDASFDPKAESLPPPAATLLEPEPIDESQPGMLISAAIFGGLALLSLMGRGAAGGSLFSQGWGTLVFVALAAYFLSRSPKVRNAIPVLRGTGRDLVAGPGWIRQRDGSRWTVADSTAILFAALKNGTVVLRLIGPPGVRDLRFASAKDPDFCMLWERWTTAEPRLELTG
jgi:hypothetical protein